MFVSGDPTDPPVLPPTETFLWTPEKRSRCPSKKNKIYIYFFLILHLVTSNLWDRICLPKHDVILQLMHNESKYL